MRESVFEDGMITLGKIWGEKNFSKERADAIWRICQFIEDDAFERAIQGAIENCQYAPTPAKFKEFVYKEIINNVENIRSTLTTKENRCTLCDNTGMVSAIKKSKPHQRDSYGFVCTHCTSARQIGLDKKGDIKRWDPRMHPKDYFPITPITKYIPDFNLSVAQNEELRVGEQFIRAELKKKVNNRQYTHTWLLEQFRNLKKEVLNGK